MNIALLLADFRPNYCGVSDYCVGLASDFNKHGHNAIIVEVGKNFNCFQVFEVMGDMPILQEEYEGFDFLSRFDHVLVQYTPFMFSKSWFDKRFRIVRLARRISKFNSQVVVTLHEAYEFHGRSVKALILAYIINLEILGLSVYSNFFVTSSETLLNKYKNKKYFCNIFWLPISSNFQRWQTGRSKHLPRPSENGICIFGGGNNLRYAFKHVLFLQDYLTQINLKFQWMVLGAVDKDLLDQLYQPIVYGPLVANDVSDVLLSAKVFVMPNAHGVSLKRTTLMAAMQHGLPVVGTDGLMTDPLLRTIDGVKLFKIDDYSSFCEAVESILSDDVRSRKLGTSNAHDYQQYFSREVRYNYLHNYLRGLG